MTNPMTWSKILIPVLGVFALSPWCPPALALGMGVLIAFFLGNPYPTKDYTHRLLSLSVIGLGAGMNLENVARVGFQGLGYTAVSLALVFALGALLQRLFRVESESAMLITVGTAICGGSAI